MKILDKLNNDLKDAMKNKDTFALSVIRMAKGAIQLEEINKKKQLEDSDVLEIISKQIKMRKDSITEFKKANRIDLVEQNEKEIELLNNYLPKQLTNEEIDKLIDEVFDKVKPTSIKDIGLVMKEIKPLVVGKADISYVSSIIKNKLNH